MYQPDDNGGGGAGRDNSDCQCLLHHPDDVDGTVHNVECLLIPSTNVEWASNELCNGLGTCSQCRG
jgi:hypothetical protein